MATQESDNPDLRDRGYIYWRLLSTDPEAAKNVVLGEKPLISESTIQIDEGMLSRLCKEISSLASVYHKLPESFVTKLKEVKKDKVKKERETDGESLLPQDNAGGNQPNIFDLDGMGESLPQTQQPAARAPANVMDELDFLSGPTTSAPSAAAPRELLLPADRANGMQISGGAVRRNNQLFLDLSIHNQSGAVLGDFAVQFNKNSFGLAPTQLQVAPVQPMQSAETSLQVSFHPSMFGQSNPCNVAQIALKNNTGVYYFQATFPFNTLLGENGEVNRDEYLNIWRGISEEHFRDVQASGNADSITAKFRQNNIFYVAKRTAGQEFVYYSAKIGETLMLLELSLGQVSRLCIKSTQKELIFGFEQAVIAILSR